MSINHTLPAGLSLFLVGGCIADHSLDLPARDLPYAITFPESSATGVLRILASEPSREAAITAELSEFVSNLASEQSRLDPDISLVISQHWNELFD